MDVLRTNPPGRGDGSRQLLVPGDAGRIVDHPFDLPDDPDPEPVPARHEDPVVARRRGRFVKLLVATTATLLAAVAFGGWLWAPFVLVTATTAGYVALLRRLKLQRDEARQVVAELALHHAGTVSPEPVAAGGESWSSSVRLRRWDD